MSLILACCRKDEAAALYLRCAEAWVHADEPGRAADYFGRSAKLVKETDEDAAAERYIFASKVSANLDRPLRCNVTEGISNCCGAGRVPYQRGSTKGNCTKGNRGKGAT